VILRVITPVSSASEATSGVRHLRSFSRPQVLARPCRARDVASHRLHPTLKVIRLVSGTNPPPAGIAWNTTPETTNTTGCTHDAHARGPKAMVTKRPGEIPATCCASGRGTIIGEAVPVPPPIWSFLLTPRRQPHLKKFHVARHPRMTGCAYCPALLARSRRPTAITTSCHLTGGHPHRWRGHLRRQVPPPPPPPPDGGPPSPASATATPVGATAPKPNRSSCINALRSRPHPRTPSSSEPPRTLSPRPERRPGYEPGPGRTSTTSAKADPYRRGCGSTSAVPSTKR
jgi:hypothetical protein